MTPVSPKKALGQHFLVDRNVLGVIERLAALEPDDVVLEIGPGLGVLTTFLADRVRFVHAIEIDRGLETSLEDALEGRENVSLTFGDALALDIEAWVRLRRSSSPTCRTTSRRHSWPRRSRVSRRFAAGA